MTYWGGNRGCEGEATQCPCIAGDGDQTCAATYPRDSLTAAWTAGLRQGPPGEVKSCTDHGVVKTPGSDFVYSFANPAIASGLLQKTTGMSYATYCDTHIFPVLGIRKSEWRWLSSKDGSSQPDGGSFHTARNYAKLAYLLVTGGKWGNGTAAQQLLDPAYVAGASKPTPSEFGPCPIYSHFFWRKDLNHGNDNARQVPPDTFYAYGGGGQFAVVIPSLDIVVVSLYGGTSVSVSAGTCCLRLLRIAAARPPAPRVTRTFDVFVFGSFFFSFLYSQCQHQASPRCFTPLLTWRIIQHVASFRRNLTSWYPTRHAMVASTAPAAGILRTRPTVMVSSAWNTRQHACKQGCQVAPAAVRRQPGTTCLQAWCSVLWRLFLTALLHRHRCEEPSSSTPEYEYALSFSPT